MQEGTWDEQEDKLIEDFQAGEIDAKTLLEGFAEIDKKRVAYIK